MNSELQRLVGARKIPLEFAQRLDKFSPGNYVLHNRLGIGKVVDWSIAKQTVTIDFEKAPATSMGLKLAFNQLTILPQGHFLVKFFDDPEGFKKMADDKATLVEFMRMILSCNLSLREGIDEVLPIDPDDLERFLSGRVVPAKSWKSWWERARVAMRDDPGFRLPTKRGEAIMMREASSAAEALLEDYSEAKTLASCVRILDLARRDMLDGEFDVMARLIREMARDIENDRAEPQHVLELIIIRDELMASVAANPETKQKLDAALADAGVESFVSLAEKLETISGESIVTYIGELSAARQRLVYMALPEAQGEEWLNYALDIFFNGGAKTTAPVADFIIAQGEKKRLFADIVNGLSRQSLSADVLIWLCRERNGLAKDILSKSKMILGSAILNAIDRDSLEGGPNRALRLRNILLEDKRLAPDLIEGLSEPEARPFAKSLYDSAVLADLDRNLLLANMMKVHPGLQDVVLSRTKLKERQHTYVSLRSFEARKAEYEDLINVRIPKNKHDLEITRAEGDLRENGGYQDAKATRQVLMRRSEELSRLLSMAEPTDFASVDTNQTGMGTRVTLASDKGKNISYTILGAWDSDPEQGVIPYSSRLGQKLCGLKLGESVRIPLEAGASPVKMTIKSIERAPKELILPEIS